MTTHTDFRHQSEVFAHVAQIARWAAQDGHAAAIASATQWWDGCKRDGYYVEAAQWADAIKICTDIMEADA